MVTVPILGQFNLLNLILETKIFNNPEHIETLRTNLQQENQKYTNLDNKDQINKILKPTLVNFIDTVVQPNIKEENNRVRTAFSLPFITTDTIVNKLFTPARIARILLKAPENELITTFIKDLATLTMDQSDKETAKKKASDAIFKAGPEAKSPAKPEAKSPAKPEAKSAAKPEAKSAAKPEAKPEVNPVTSGLSWQENPMAVGGKQKSRRLVVRRKKKETKRYNRRN